MDVWTLKIVILLFVAQCGYSAKHLSPGWALSHLSRLGSSSRSDSRLSVSTNQDSRVSHSSLDFLRSAYKGGSEYLNRFQPSQTSNCFAPPCPVCSEPPLVCAGGRFRTADGTCNNARHPTWGASGRPQVRLLTSEYSDGRDKPRTKGKDFSPLPSARSVSQTLHTGDNLAIESPDLTHMLTMWGQFLDHDITHTPVARDLDGSKLDCCDKPAFFPKRDLYWMPSSSFAPQTTSSHPNCFPISLSPETDRFFKTDCMNFVRSKAFAPSATCRSEKREQGNIQTSYIDASQVYGASLGDQASLRSWNGGQLKSAENDLLPQNSTTMCTKRPNTRDFCFGSGDPRVNEHPMLSSIHTVFHRLHNLLTSDLTSLNPHWDDERLFQEARKIIGAIMQYITYAEYLPLVLGDAEMERYNLATGNTASYFRYEPDTNPGIFNAFSTAAFRFGHSMINGHNSFGFQTLHLQDTFFRPNFVQRDQGAGLNMVLNGLIRDQSQSFDRFMNADVTDHLFRNQAGQSLDLASLNVQRGRDHGLPAYNAFRKLCGLPSLQEVLATGKMADVPFLRVYRNLDDVDLFTGGLSEPPVPGGVVGPTFSCIIGRQFRNLKFGDRFWYQNTRHEGAFSPAQIRAIERVGLADVLCWTTAMTAVPDHPFVEASAGNPVKECHVVLPIDLSAWLEVRPSGKGGRYLP